MSRHIMLVPHASNGNSDRVRVVATPEPLEAVVWADECASALLLLVQFRV